MNKKDLVAAVAAEAHLTKKDAGKAVNAMMKTVATAMVQGRSVVLSGFGTFGTRQRKERTMRDPRTGAAVQVSAMTVPVFKAGKTLKETVAEK